MKLLLLTFSLMLTLSLPAQHLGVGDTLLPFSLPVLGEEKAVLHSSDLAGKVILLDFWATWCSPCISGMPHLDDLQKEFSDQLAVIAVSEEKPDRLLRFIESTAYNFRFARDTGALRQRFHYQVIPHSVLIDTQGVVVAITAPENITSAVIEKVFRREPIDLPLKEDRQDFDPGYDYFQADTLTRNSFVLQPHKPNLPAYSKAYWEGPFKARRFTAYNMTVDGFYRHAYQTTSYRLDYEFDEALVDWEDEANRYCLDIIVPGQADLFPALKSALSAAFPIQARLEEREKEVIVISTLNGEVKAPSGTATPQYAGRGDGFSSSGASMTLFCDYLEGFGIFGYPVVDETGSDDAFVIDFSFDPENADSFKAEMERYGLTYKKVRRSIPVLVLYLKE